VGVYPFLAREPFPFSLCHDSVDLSPGALLPPHCLQCFLLLKSGPLLPLVTLLRPHHPSCGGGFQVPSVWAVASSPLVLQHRACMTLLLWVEKPRHREQ
jgi:hypothetical protein